jgi:transcriptional regulator with XRE-family HTH domain
MRLSPQRHTLAVLRTVIGITQKEMAALLECSTPTIQAIELGKLKLSERLAEQVVLKTGVELSWLMNNEPNRPPVTSKGLPYSKELFEDFQAGSRLAAEVQGVGLVLSGQMVQQAILRLAALTMHTYKTKQLPLFAYKLAKAFEDLEKRFGVSDAERQLLSQEAYARKQPKEIFTHSILALLDDKIAEEFRRRGKEGGLERYASASFEFEPQGQVSYVPGSVKKQAQPAKSPTSPEAKASPEPQKKKTAPRKR